MSAPKGRILVVDDDPAMLKAASAILIRDGHEVTSVHDPVEALQRASEGFEVVVTDVRMPYVSGLEVLTAVRQLPSPPEVILMTGHGTVQAAVDAVKEGAFDYLTKPFERIEDFSLKVQRALERRLLREKNDQLVGTLEAREAFQGLIGRSQAMKSVYQLVESVASSAATVLVHGESGTGKELVAHAIHALSPRKAKPFLAVNCSALTETLLESELFGHVKGAFTGALSNKTGLFEAAHGGTLFLDEIGDVPLSTQVRLLRVLQEGEVRRVGATQNLNVDTRIVAATNVDLIAAMKAGTFREDLYYRLSVVPISLPPLRERPEDVPLLAQHFLARSCARHGRKVEGIERRAVDLLVGYGWPGNVRELQHVIERAVVLSPRARLDVEDLPEALRAPTRLASSDAASLANLPFAQAKQLTINAFERRYLSQMLERSRGNVTQAALAAGMDRSNFRRLLKQHELYGNREEAEAEPQR